MATTAVRMLVTLINAACRRHCVSAFLPADTCISGQLCAGAQVNTVATVFTSRGMQHTEGGWPKEVDPTEAEHVIRYRRKARRHAC